MTKIIEQIKEYYTIEDNNGRLTLSDGDYKKNLFKTGSSVVLTFGKKVKKEDVEKEIELGNVIKIPEIDIYKLYFNWDDERYSMERYGYDLRTSEYLANTQKNIGYIETKHGWDEIELTESRSFPIFSIAVGKSELGVTESNKWCYQFGYPAGIDDYNIEKIYFNKRPNKQDIIMARQIETIKLNFFLRRARPEFTCWECGSRNHWLDIPGELGDKVENLKEKYCGC